MAIFWPKNQFQILALFIKLYPMYVDKPGKFQKIPETKFGGLKFRDKNIREQKFDDEMSCHRPI